MRGDRLARLLQHSYGDVPSNARKVIEKLIKGLASFKIARRAEGRELEGMCRRVRLTVVLGHDFAGLLEDAGQSTGRELGLLPN